MMSSKAGAATADQIQVKAICDSCRLALRSMLWDTAEARLLKRWLQTKTFKFAASLTCELVKSLFMIDWVQMRSGCQYSILDWQSCFLQLMCNRPYNIQSIIIQSFKIDFSLPSAPIKPPVFSAGQASCRSFPDFLRFPSRLCTSCVSCLSSFCSGCQGQKFSCYKWVEFRFKIDARSRPPSFASSMSHAIWHRVEVSFDMSSQVTCIPMQLFRVLKLLRSHDWVAGPSCYPRPRHMLLCQLCQRIQTSHRLAQFCIHSHGLVPRQAK